MSKKGRQRRQAYLQSLKENSQAKAAKTAYVSSAKKKESTLIFVLRSLMLVIFMYSGFYYGGTLIFSIFGKYIDPIPPAWVGQCILFGTILTAIGVGVEFFSKHLISFIMVLFGAILYLRGVFYLISYIRKRLDEVVADGSLIDMDRIYMYRHYPIAGCVVISFIILVISLVKKRRLKHLKDTAPVKSIVD